MIDIETKSIFVPDRMASIGEIDEISETSSFRFARKNGRWTATKNL